MSTFLISLISFIFPYFRRKRFELLKQLFLFGNKKITILDIGGTQEFWVPHKSDLKKCSITILNLIKIAVTFPNFRSVVGDARDMKQFRDKEFDVVFSNSVIEHVGNLEDQKRMAMEIQRVGKHYFVQTPNYYFPIEPHFLFPFFQFLSKQIKIFLIRHFRLGWRPKTPNYKKAAKMVNSVRLLKKEELLTLFSECSPYEEKLFGFTKSFIVYK